MTHNRPGSPEGISVVSGNKGKVAQTGYVWFLEIRAR